MIFLVALIPATALAIAGYFVLYLSGRSEGALRTAGKYLAYWAFTLAGLVILGAVVAAAHGGHHGMFGPGAMDGRMHGRWSNEMHSRGSLGGEGDRGRPDDESHGASPDASAPSTRQGTGGPASR